MPFKLNSLEGLSDKINLLDDRTAIGLPPHYVNFTADNCHEENAKYYALSPKQLVDIVENINVTQEKRYAAGSLLGVIGDPRISVFNPKMIVICGGKATIGLRAEKIDEVFELYKDTGFKKEWLEKEIPEHKVTIGTFKIAKYPVTNFEFLHFLKENPNEEVPSSWAFSRYPMHASNQPVYSVKPETAENYAQWLSQKTGRAFALPTEMQWEYAAAGAEGREFPWGEHYLEDAANTAEEGFIATTPIGMFPKGNTPTGICDMGGNVEEYVSGGYFTYPGGKDITDDLTRADPHYRIARGGGFARHRELARCKRRHGRFVRSIYAMGFRLVENL